MGTYIKGIHGGTSGKVGNVIGSNWHDIDYWRSLSRKSNKPASQAQLDVRFIFAIMRAFLKPLAGLIKLSFAGAKSKTPMNAALSFNISNAVTGTSPNFTVNYPKVKFSTGPLDPPQRTFASALSPATVGLSWGKAMIKAGDNKPTDVAMIVIYNPSQMSFVVADDVAVRSDLQASVTVPAEFAGDLVHAWLFFIDEEGKRVSDSVHVGMVTVL